MKKTKLIVFLMLGLIVLAGCDKEPTSQTEGKIKNSLPTAPVPPQASSILEETNEVPSTPPAPPSLPSSVSGDENQDANVPVSPQAESQVDESDNGGI